MVRAAIWLYSIAVLAGVPGFGGIAAASAGIAKMIFYYLSFLAILSVLISHLLGGRSTTIINGAS